MKFQDLAVNGFFLICLVSLIVLSVRPQSNFVQIKEKPSAPSPSDVEPENKQKLIFPDETDAIAVE